MLATKVTPTLQQLDVLRVGTVPKLFYVKYDNSKRPHGKPVQKVEAYGVVFPNGATFIDSGLPAFNAPTDMLDWMHEFGKVELFELL